MSQEIEILYKNSDFVFVNKPSGIPVHRSRECPDVESLVQKLRRQIGPDVFPIHRLDRGVSGVIGFGQSSESARKLQELLSHSSAEKIYIALVRGKVIDAFSVDHPLTNDRDVVQAAKTDFKLLAANEYCSLVMARIHTGRKHQIRRHLSHVAHHILGDRHYGKGRLNNLYRDKYGLNRIFLHALQLSVTNDEGQRLQVFAPLPEDLKSVLHKISEEGLLDPQVINRILENSRIVEY